MKPIKQLQSNKHLQIQLTQDKKEAGQRNKVACRGPHYNWNKM